MTFLDLLRSVQTLERETEVWKATGSYRTYSIPSKLQAWFPSLQWKTYLWTELQPWFLRLQQKTEYLYILIYQTIVQSILTYGAEVWQIPTREIKRILSTEMDVLRRSAGKSRMDKIRNKEIKEIMGVQEKPDIIDIIEKKRLQWYGHVKRMPEQRLPKLIIERIPI